jgi:hypothetical protein
MNFEVLDLMELIINDLITSRPIKSREALYRMQNSEYCIQLAIHPGAFLFFFFCFVSSVGAALQRSVPYLRTLVQFRFFKLLLL